MSESAKPFGILQFFERFPDEEACLQHIFKVRFGNHSPCPICGIVGKWTRIGCTKKWRHSCGKHVSVLKGTVMYRSNLSLLAWFYAFFIFSNSSIGVPSGFIRRQLGIGPKSAYRLCRMIRVHMASMARPGIFGGPKNAVQVDEVLLRYITNPGGGANDAVILLGLASEGKVLSAIIPDRRAATLIPRITAHVVPGTTVITDMLSGYGTLAQFGYDHVQIDHSVAFHDFRGNTTNGIEAYWSTVRRMLRSARQVSRTQMWTYIAEIEFKYNRRHHKSTIFEELISQFPLYTDEVERDLECRFDWSLPR